ncbi:MAG: helix-turn-helix domain-containing protein [Dehalococcoidia bacterium]
MTSEHAEALVDRLEPAARGLVLVALVERIARDAAASAAASVPAAAPTPTHSRALLSTAAAAKYLVMSRTRLAQLADAGEVPCIRRAGEKARRFRVADLEAYAQRLTHETELRRQEVVRPLRRSAARSAS